MLKMIGLNTSIVIWSEKNKVAAYFKEPEWSVKKNKKFKEW